MKPAILFFIFCLCAVTMSAQNQLEQLSVADSVLLKEVIVKADKKLVTLKSDRYVVDATSIKVGKVHLHDLLRDVPGVIQDKDHISILGKSGVKIMINGRLKMCRTIRSSAFLKLSMRKTTEAMQAISFIISWAPER